MFSKPTVFAALLSLASFSAADVLCDLGQYPSATCGPIQDGIDYLRNTPSETFAVSGHACGVVSCSYGTGFNVCNDGDDMVSPTWGSIADTVDAAFQECATIGCTDGTVVGSMQNFVEGYNVLVEGGYGC